MGCVPLKILLTTVPPCPRHCLICFGFGLWCLFPLVMFPPLPLPFWSRIGPHTSPHRTPIWWGFARSSLIKATSIKMGSGLFIISEFITTTYPWFVLLIRLGASSYMLICWCFARSLGIKVSSALNFRRSALSSWTIFAISTGIHSTSVLVLICRCSLNGKLFFLSKLISSAETPSSFSFMNLV